MRRGHLVPMRVSVPRFLGAIDFQGDTPRALGVWDETGESRGVYPVEEGRAVVPSLEEGSYSVGLCEDADCSSVAVRLEDVRIEAGRFTMIR